MAVCEECWKKKQNKKENEAWEKAEEVDWDGETPLVLFWNDRYFFSLDDVWDYVDQLEEPYTIEDLRFELCEPYLPRSFDIIRYMDEYISEDDDIPQKDVDEIEEIVNDWISGHLTSRWIGSGKKVSMKSLKEWLDYECPRNTE
jgi:hypothetical protein